MKTLKLALLITTACGAVAAGGVTYATVGNSSPAPSAQSLKDAKASVAKHLPAVPAAPSVPTCLPDVPKGQALKKIKALAKKSPDAPVALPATPGAAPQIPAKLPKVPVSTPDVAGKVPDAKSKLSGAKDQLSGAKDQLSGAKDKLSGAKDTIMKAKDAAKLPVCRAEQKSKSVNPPNVPSKPNLPVPAGVSCSSLPPAIDLHKAKSPSFKLPNGSQLTVGHAHSIIIQSQAACEYTQQLVTSSGQNITVERIKTPPQVTLQEMAQSLKMAGSYVMFSGVETWQSPLNDGMLWYAKDGYAFRLTGSPATAALLPGLATQMQTQ